MTRPAYQPPQTRSLLCLVGMGVVCLIAAFLQKNPILQLGGWPVFPGTPHYRFLTDIQAIQPGMTVKEVRQRLARYEERSFLPENLSGWEDLPEVKKAIQVPHLRQGFTGELSYNHNDSDRVPGSYIVHVVDNHVAYVSIYDD
jgi:hypothetical protein